MINVLVYTAPETVDVSLDHTLSMLRSLLSLHYSVQTISQQSLASQPWANSCALLVFPTSHLLSLGPAIAQIQAFLENGGALLGLSLGAHYSDVTTENSESSVSLVFDGGISPNFRPSEGPPRSVAIRLVGAEKRTIRGLFQHGERRFTGLRCDAPHAKVLAKYIDGEADSEPAALCCTVGAGKAILWGPSLEYPINNDNGSASHRSSSLTLEETRVAEEERRKTMQDTLQELRLIVPSQDAKPLIRPLPQFLTSHPSRPTVVSQIMASLATHSPASQLTVFQDANDTFNFHPLAESDSILDEYCKNPLPPLEPTKQPKHIIVCSNGELPSRKHTPLFDLALYYESLSIARATEGLPDAVDQWGFGEALLYGETVTSTQTMLDK
jgi:biotin---protein ligase